MSTAREGFEDAHRDGFLSAVQSLLILVVVALFLMTFLVQPFRIPTESMQPTLQVGDFLLVNKQAFAPRGSMDAVLPPTAVRRGDVMVFHFPPDPSIHVVKRVVALPGDRLRMRDGTVYVNGHAVAEPYAYFAPAIPDMFRDDFPALHNMSSNVEPHWWSTLRRNVSEGELFVPAGDYFVMGDNRNNSEDSRYWGFVPQAAIVGRPLLVYFSLAPAANGAGWRQRAAKLWHSERLVR